MQIDGFLTPFLAFFGVMLGLKLFFHLHYLWTRNPAFAQALIALNFKVDKNIETYPVVSFSKEEKAVAFATRKNADVIPFEDILQWRQVTRGKRNNIHYVEVTVRNHEENIIRVKCNDEKQSSDLFAALLVYTS